MRLLLVEDSRRLQRSLGEGLRRLGHAIDLASDGEQGLWLAEVNDYDVVLLDVMLPKLDGFELLRRLRAGGRQHQVLILSARDLVEDRIEGLNLGADDYLVKPFDFDELCARIQALGRRGRGDKSPRIDLGTLQVDTAARRAFVEGLEVPLGAREFAVLELLASRRGEIVTRRELREKLWDFEAETSSNVVDVLVYALRKKLADLGVVELIQTRRGMGYLIEDRQP